MGAVKKTPSKAKKPTTNRGAEAQLAGFLAKYDPEIEALAREARKRMQARLPGATELVYDNYNALAIGYGPSERSLARKWQGCAAHRFTKRSRYRTACCRGSHRTGIGTGQGSSRSKLATTVGDQVGVSQAAATTSDEVAQHCRRVAPHVGDALDSFSS